MKHRSRPAEQDDLLRPRLVDMTNRSRILMPLLVNDTWREVQLVECSGSELQQGLAGNHTGRQSR